MFSSNTTQVSQDANYIEDVFSTWLYTGNGSTQTITNGIDLAGNGGLVWVKNRTAPGSTHVLVDTARGAGNFISSDRTGAQINNTSSVSSFSSTGFSVGAYSNTNGSGDALVSWTFREQAKFFDVVTYTGDGSLPRSIPHNLGSTPGFFVIKRTDATGSWITYHRSVSNGSMFLNSTAALDTTAGFGSVTSTSFELTSNVGFNGSGATYVAYLFAHDAGGFGLTGTDNVISCGGFTSDASGGATVTLGYEPQWILLKRTSGTASWAIFDNMRGLNVSSTDAILYPNLSNAETIGDYMSPTATGFVMPPGVFAGAAEPFIYIAIRRGPMKVPTTGTSVFYPLARTGNRAAGSVTGVGFPPDALMTLNRTPGGYNPEWNNKLVGPTKYLRTSTTGSEVSSTDLASYNQDGVSFNATDYNSIVNLNSPLIQYFLRRAPGFFDEVCYTGNGPGTQVINHNLGVAPELSIFKARSGTGGWTVYNGATQFLRLNETAAGATDGNISPTSTTVTVSSSLGFGFNDSGVTYVAYLFASAPGVSKVGSYTGTGTTQTINCGFTAGSRFVMIKRTDSTGDWYVWDSARGIVAGNDPYLLLNSTAAEVTSTDYVDTASTGFEISSTAPAAINASGGTYIFLAIA